MGGLQNLEALRTTTRVLILNVFSLIHFTIRV